MILQGMQNLPPNPVWTFAEYAKRDGIVLTKLDGTAKGGVIIAIEKEYKLPVVFVGTGEGVGDIAQFDAKEFVEGLF